MSFILLPMDVDRPVLWLLALVAITATGIGLGIGWSAAQTSLVEIQVRDHGADAPVEITLEKSENGSFHLVEEATLNPAEADNATVRWTTRETGWYRLLLATPDRECEMRIFIQRSGDELTGRMLADSDGECPDVMVAVNEIERPFWLV
ncbi:hypothetical protein [Halorussus ruber]|uniref:hypothetical protein n=1 Tax=Halorussus ruber TaxID=1126238 RepID=UPI001092A625|nr:hypothetical protein [Halorussus ruber]